MTQAVLIMSIGPVQDFIAQARRSRDLWFGSHVLSEVSRAAAKAAVNAANVELVFPALERGDAELTPCDAPIRDATGLPPLNVGNRLLAVVPADQALAIARSMKQSALERWQQIARWAQEKADAMHLLADEIDAVWTEQIESLLEVTAASAPFTSADSYAEARRAAERALAARKNLREFSPWKHDRTGAPKSSFDGGRVSVLTSRRDGISARHGRTVRLGAGEQLDAIGVVKRLGGEPDQFVPLANVALADWIEAARKQAPGKLAQLAAACEDGIGRVVRRDLPWTHWTNGRSFDAEVLLEGRLPGVLAECGIVKHAHDMATVKQWRTAHLDPLLSEIHSPPIPSVCCLVADGDHMGAAIDGIKHPNQHRKLSRQLATFASRAQEILARHKGFAIYTGGDDVLGFLAPAHAPAAAAELHADFAATMDSLDFVREKPTLSIGLGIGHILDGMAHLLALGRRAERLAKQGQFGSPRNSLAVIVDRRSGSDVEWCANWPQDPVGQLEQVAGAWGEALPAGKVHELRAAFNRLPRPAAGVNDGFAAVLRGEVQRILSRANLGVDGSRLRLRPDTVGLDLAPTLDYPAAHAKLSAWLALALVAREFAVVRRSQ